MGEIKTAKLISPVKIDFSTEADLELYINMFEKEGEGFWVQLKEIGLLRWRKNRIWNKKVVSNYLRSLNTRTNTLSKKCKNCWEIFLKARRTSLAKLISKEPLLETSIFSITTISLAAPWKNNNVTIYQEELMRFRSL